MTLLARSAGLLTTVQDAGRAGHQREGVPVSGAMDPFALRVANLLVGNEEGAAALEITLLGPELRFEGAALVALAGAELGAYADGTALPAWHAAWLPEGAVLSFQGGAAGCRAYLAVAGGIDVPPVLGSRSTFVRAALGGVEGRALRQGDRVPIGAPGPLSERIAAGLRGSGGGVVVDRVGAGPSLLPTYAALPRLRLLEGSPAAKLTPASRRVLYEGEFRLSPRSDRTGCRLEGARLELAERREILSEGVVFGTVQLPPDGEPIVLMADRQTTGGYPRIGEVASVDLPLLAQLRPGDRLGFRPCSLAEAHSLHRARERGITRAREAISLLHG